MRRNPYVILPVAFYEHHRDAGMPTPFNHAEEPGKVAVLAHDPATRSLYENAKRHSERYATLQIPYHLSRSALATVRAIERVWNGG